MEQDPTWVLTSCGQMKLISRFMVTLTTITVAFGRPLIHVRPFFFETRCPVNGWITETVNVQRYLTLLREIVVPCLIQRGQISNVRFMQDGATSHTANPVKAFLIQTSGEDRIVSRRCRYPWPPRSPDLTPADHTSGHVALCGCWICHSSGMSSPLWWWSCGTYSGVIKL
ncbi:DUF4817 domain-containing protein [Trichonephila clavipes]|nr:DUF4817 domain-containing protein [Trichonephila clavipes]